MNRTQVKKFHQTKQSQILINKIELARLIQLPEKEFAKLIKEIEDNSLFKKLCSSDNNYKIIKREQFPRTDLSKSFYELNEGISADKSLLDVESVLDNHKECILIIRKIGEDKFKEYFLSNESIITQQEIAKRCGLSVDEVKKVAELINYISINLEHYYPSSIDSRYGVHYTKVASIEKDDSGYFLINLFSPNFARGKYIINYEKLAELNRRKIFPVKERKQINKLLHNLELINSRKSAIYKIIQGIINAQKSFFISGEKEDMVSVRQKDLVKETKIDSSLICRAINGRSVITPQGEEMPIKHFFPSKKEIRKNIVKNIVFNEEEFLTDEDIKSKLKKEYGIAISRRSIAESRKELKIASSSKRKLYKTKEII